ncbi:hypothetical protein FHW67_000907 [Herbaspirillum sp. Sphag1AN]|nr:hypothetical protein [Herbaspirillum sp. Sphag1AN]MBB3245073.1 hypothetical protein [Herbaspirillum sp. Sphag64]
MRNIVIYKLFFSESKVLLSIFYYKREVSLICWTQLPALSIRTSVSRRVTKPGKTLPPA